MGKERISKRKYLLFYTPCTVIVALFLQGCAYIPREVLEEYTFKSADQYIKEGNYKAALGENESILRDNPRRFGDMALYRIGLIYANPENKFADEDKAIEYFKDISDKYPRSSLDERARLWVLKLRKMKDYKSQMLKQEKEIITLKSILKNAEERNQIFQNKIKVLESQIENLKKIDLGIGNNKTGGTQ